jgi:hypothetical protein
LIEHGWKSIGLIRLSDSSAYVAFKKHYEMTETFDVPDKRSYALVAAKELNLD